MTTYHVTYFYGRPYQKDCGRVDADSKDQARDIVARRNGTNEEEIDWLKGFLRAEEVANT